MQEVRTLKGTGVVEVDYDEVSFTVISTCDGNSSVLAKQNIALTVSELEKTIDTIQKNLGVTIIPGTLRKSNDIQPKHRFDPETRAQLYDGYTLTHSLTFRTEDVGKTSQIQDSLTNVSNSQVNAPVFQFSDPDTHYGKLFGAALDDAKRKFNIESTLLGLNSTDYEIIAWGDRASHFDLEVGIATASLAGAPARNGGMDVESGRAQLTLTVPFIFSKKESVV